MSEHGRSSRKVTGDARARWSVNLRALADFLYGYAKEAEASRARCVASRGGGFDIDNRLDRFTADALWTAAEDAYEALAIHTHAIRQACAAVGELADIGGLFWRWRNGEFDGWPTGDAAAACEPLRLAAAAAGGREVTGPDDALRLERAGPAPAWVSAGLGRALGRWMVRMLTRAREPGEVFRLLVTARHPCEVCDVSQPTELLGCATCQGWHGVCLDCGWAAELSVACPDASRRAGGD